MFYQFYLHSKALTPIISEFTEKINLPAKVSFEYQRGWDNQTDLLDALEQELYQNKPPLTTGCGPHRADLLLKWQGKKFSQSSSRGQQKALTIAMYLAQSTYMEREFKKKSVYLVDELPAELDQPTSEKILTLLTELNSQVIITTVSDFYLREQIPEEANWFHVEHGQVNLMV